MGIMGMFMTGVAAINNPQNGVATTRFVAGTWRMASWKWSAQERLEWIKGCEARGIDTFDHADIYGEYTVESLFGEALALDRSVRNHIRIISKTGIALKSRARPEHVIKHYRNTREHIISSVELSLRALRTDRIDVLLLHRPSALLDADEVALAFEALSKSGKVLAFGASNYSVSQFELLNSRWPLITNQIECSPLQLAALNDGTLDQAQRFRKPPMIWSPLAGGRLFSEAPAAQRVRQALSTFASARQISLEAAAYAWLLRLPSHPVCVLGSRKVASIEAAMTALEVHYDEQAWFEVLEAATGQPVA